jgi:methyl-accepting chemotaxis protein
MKLQELSKELSIGTRLFSLLGFLVAVLLCLGLFSINLVTQANQRLQDQYNNTTLPLQYISNIESLMQANQLILLRAITNPSSENSKNAVTNVSKNIVTISGLLAKFKGTAKTPAEKKLIETFDIKRTAFVEKGIQPMLQAFRDDSAARAGLIEENLTNLWAEVLSLIHI